MPPPPPPFLLRYWLPPALWMSAIFLFSTDIFSGSNTGSTLERILHALGLTLAPETLALLHFSIRKAAHLTAYAILALLLYRAFRSGNQPRWRFQWALYAFLIAAVWALLDEYHQTLTAHRTGTIIDSFIDMSGSVIALSLRRVSLRNHRARD